MDGCDLKHQAHKPGEVKTSATRNDAVASRRPKTRDVSSRYRSPSPSPSTLSSSRRCQSPPSRTLRLTSDSAPKMSKSAERKRPSSPPLKESSVDIQISSGKVLSGRSPEGLWPSTMRRLSVSLQKEKPVTKKVEVGTKSSSEKKRSPLVRKNVSENSKPSSKSVDLIDKMARSSLPPVSSRRMSLDGMVKPVKKTATDAARLPSAVDRVKIGLRSIDDNHLRVPRPKKLVPDKSLHSSPSKTSSPVSRGPSAARQSNTTRGISPTPARQSTSKRGISPSPSRGTSPTPARHSISTRGISPASTKPSSTPSRGTSPAPALTRQSTPARGISPGPAISPTPSRGTSPTPARPSTPSTSSVLSFIADFRNGKKSATNVEDAHQLRLLYNRYLQWKFANARAGVVLQTKEVIAEKTLYNVWNDTLALCETVALKRISLQQLRLELRLNLLLNEQIGFLDDWALLERDHISSLSGALDDLNAGTIRLPVTRGARVDTESLRLAVCSAVDVMQAMGSSICSLLSQVERVNSLVSELAFVALQEIEMLDHCEALLASTAAVRVEEYSLRTHLIQMRQASNKKSH